MLAVLLSCVLVEQTSALPDIAGIISGLSQKAMGILKGVTLPVLNSQVGFIRRHIDGLLSFFKDKEGEISIPNTPFTIHFTAERCHLLGIGKRLLLVDFQTCKAEASENTIGLTASCEKRSQKEAIECATEQVLNLLKAVSAAVQRAGSNNS